MALSTLGPSIPIESGKPDDPFNGTSSIARKSLWKTNCPIFSFSGYPEQTGWSREQMAEIGQKHGLAETGGFGFALIERELVITLFQFTGMDFYL